MRKTPWHSSACWPGSTTDLPESPPARIVRERNRSREFIEFLKFRCPPIRPRTAIKNDPRNHSAHSSAGKPRAWPRHTNGRPFDFVHPKHGSWSNLIEGVRSQSLPVLSWRHIRVTSKHELTQDYGPASTTSIVTTGNPHMSIEASRAGPDMIQTMENA